MRLIGIVSVIGMLVAAGLYSQRPAEEPSWGLKPLELPKYQGVHKPHTKLADVKAKHAGKKAWREVIIDDDHLQAAYIMAPVGAKVGRRFHPDTREWWVVMEGQIRFEIEGQEPVVARKGSMVQVPMQTIYSMEVIGNEPALRYEVNIAKAKTFFPKDVTPPQIPGYQWLPVVLNRRPGAYKDGNVPHINLYDLAAKAENKDKNWQHRFIHDDRAVSNVIYGSEKRMGPLNPKDRGHYHPECAESWLIMRGKIRYPIEGQGVVIASEGDVVYVPLYTFHAPRFYGEEDSCRLALNGYTNIAHVFDSARPH